jgi:hypothetical protein
MEPIGVIAERYVLGELEDDSEVALSHLPPELGSRPLSEARVEAEATVARLLSAGLVTTEEHGRLLSSIAGLHFADRTVAAIISRAGLPPRRRALIGELYGLNRVPLKRLDAELLAERLRVLPDLRGPRPAWSFNRSPIWRQLYPSL